MICTATAGPKTVAVRVNPGCPPKPIGEHLGISLSLCAATALSFGREAQNPGVLAAAKSALREFFQQSTTP